MAKMRAIDAAVHVLEREGVTTAFGVPGAAINPLYSAMRARGSIAHVLARHVEGASHMAEGYTRAVAGNIGVCIGTSGPAGTDMITGLYSAMRGFDPDPVHHGTGAARALVQGRLPGGRHRSDREAGHQVGGHGARAGAGAARVPAGIPRDAFGSAGSGADRPAVRRADGRDRVRPRDLRAAAGVQAGGHARAGRESARHAQRGERAADRCRRRHHQRRCVRLARAVRRSHRRAGHSDADGLGHDPRRSSADGRHGAACRRRTATATRRCSPPTSCSASATAGPIAIRASVDVYTKGRKFVHVDIEPTQIGRVFGPDLGIVSDAKAALELFVDVAREWKAAGRLPDRGAWLRECQERKRTLLAQDELREQADEAATRVPMHEQRVRQGHLLREHHRPVADRGRAVPARLQAAQLDQLRPGGPARMDHSGGARRARCRSARERSWRCRATTISSS